MPAKLPRFDIAVAGGGISGACAALGLAQAGFSVALIDPSPPTPITSTDPWQLRVSTLSPASKNILSRLGAWSAIVASERAGRFTKMCVWERDRRDELRFDAADAGLSELGWVAENMLMRAAVWPLLARAGVDFKEQTLDRVELSEQSAVAGLSDGGKFKAALLIGADGPNSMVREAAGIEAERYSYRQAGLVCVVRAERPHEATAWQRFLSTGPLGLLPLADGAYSIVWSLPEAEAERLCAAPASEFDAALTAALGERLGGPIECQSERVSFPLTRLSAQRYCSGPVALIGDAAHVVHPLAGQGANLGLLDAAALVECLTAARAAGRGPANRHSLRRYERWRRSDNELLGRSLTLIKAWFERDRGVLAETRRLGTALITRSGWLRGPIVRHASGFGGRVPQLARPPLD